jgi:hypothetical protein
MTIALFAALSGVGCAGPQAFGFTTSRSPADAVDDVARTLSANGHEPSTIDRKAGLITTRWFDTGERYGYIQKVQATLVTRFIVTVAPVPAGASVSVREDRKRCQQGSYDAGDVDVRGSCETVLELSRPHEPELDELGAKLQRALQSGG